MSDDLEHDLPLTGAQALAGHEAATLISRRVLEGSRWLLKEARVAAATRSGPRTAVDARPAESSSFLLQYSWVAVADHRSSGWFVQLSEPSL